MRLCTGALLQLLATTGLNLKLSIFRCSLFCSSQCWTDISFFSAVHVGHIALDFGHISLPTSSALATVLWMAKHPLFEVTFALASSCFRILSCSLLFCISKTLQRFSMSSILLDSSVNWVLAAWSTYKKDPHDDGDSHNCTDKAPVHVCPFTDVYANSLKKWWYHCPLCRIGAMWDRIKLKGKSVWCRNKR